MNADKVVNSIRMFLAIIVSCGGWYFIFDFFFHKIGEGIRLVDWLNLLVGVLFVVQGGLFIYTTLKKRKEEKDNKGL